MIKPKVIVTPGKIQNTLDEIDHNFRHTANREQAILEETELLKQFVLMCSRKYEVRNLRECAETLAKRCKFISFPQ